MKYFFNISILFSTMLLLNACANIVAPTGGAKDIKEPKLGKVTPPNGQTNFKGKIITLSFDENINIDKLDDQMFITPRYKGTYKSKYKGKNLTIEFKEPFDSNTTYTINFGNGITDVTEKNPAQNISLCFSTGKYLDSTSISGSVIDPLTTAPCKKCIVSLYPAHDTLKITKDKPYYFVKTDANGSFILKNIKNETYNLYAVDDIDGNEHYSSVNEEIAFMENLVIDHNLNNLQLEVFSQDTTPSEVLYQKNNKQYESLKFSKGLTGFKVDNKDFRYFLSNDTKTAKVFYPESSTWKSLMYTAVDSSGNIIYDTLLLEGAQKTDKINNFLSYLYPIDYKIIKEKIEIKLGFDIPIKSFNSDSIKVLINHKYIDNKTITLKYDSLFNRIDLSSTTKLNTDSLILEIPQGTIVSISNDTLKKTTLYFRFKREEDVSLLAGKINTKREFYIVQLVDNKNNVVKTERNISTFNYNYLEPGAYRIRAIVDTNNNGKWDSGNLSKNIQPEKVIYYKDILSLKANWEVLDLIFEF